MSKITFDSEIDCRGLNCPLPILKTKKAVDGLSSGQVLKMLATDPGSVNDVQSWSKRTENTLIDHSEDGSTTKDWPGNTTSETGTQIYSGPARFKIWGIKINSLSD